MRNASVGLSPSLCSTPSALRFVSGSMRACIIAVFMNSTVSHTQHKGKHYLFADYCIYGCLHLLGSLPWCGVSRHHAPHPTADSLPLQAMKSRSVRPIPAKNQLSQPAVCKQLALRPSVVDPLTHPRPPGRVRAGAGRKRGEAVRKMQVSRWRGFSEDAQANWHRNYGVFGNRSLDRRAFHMPHWNWKFAHGLALLIDMPTWGERMVPK